MPKVSLSCPGAAANPLCSLLSCKAAPKSPQALVHGWPGPHLAAVPPPAGFGPGHSPRRQPLGAVLPPGSAAVGRQAGPVRCSGGRSCTGSQTSLPAGSRSRHLAPRCGAPVEKIVKFIYLFLNIYWLITERQNANEGKTEKCICYLLVCFPSGHHDRTGPCRKQDLRIPQESSTGLRQLGRPLLLSRGAALELEQPRRTVSHVGCLSRSRLTC